MNNKEEEKFETLMITIDKIINPKKFNYNKEEKRKMKEYILPILEKELNEYIKKIPKEKREEIAKNLLMDFLTK